MARRATPVESDVLGGEVGRAGDHDRMAHAGGAAASSSTPDAPRLPPMTAARVSMPTCRAIPGLSVTIFHHVTTGSRAMNLAGVRLALAMGPVGRAGQVVHTNDKALGSGSCGPIMLSRNLQCLSGQLRPRGTGVERVADGSTALDLSALSVP